MRHDVENNDECDVTYLIVTFLLQHNNLRVMVYSYFHFQKKMKMKMEMNFSSSLLLMASIGKGAYYLQQQEQQSDVSIESEEEEDNEDEASHGSPLLVIEEEDANAIENNEMIKKKKTKMTKKELKAYLNDLEELYRACENCLSEEDKIKQLTAYAESHPLEKPKKTKKNADDEALHVDRKKSAYNYFYESHSKECEGMKLGDRTKHMSQLWNAVEDKSEWDALAAEDKKRYDADMMRLNPNYKPKVSVGGHYALFSKAEREKLNSEPEFHEASKKDLNKICRKRWRELDEKDKGMWYAKRAKIGGVDMNDEDL